MPYITQDKRKPLQDYIDVLADKIWQSHVHAGDRNGLMNYVISKLIRDVYGPDEHGNNPWRYSSINDVVGVLSCAQAEFYAKVALPYERKKEEENGPVYCCRATL